MVRRFGVVVGVLALVSAGALADEPVKRTPEQTLEALVKAYNQSSGKDVHDLGDDGFRKALPAATLQGVLGGMRRRYGGIVHVGEPTTDGPARVYPVRGERAPFLMRVVLDDSGRLTGLLFRPAFLADLPRQPITADEMRRRLEDAAEQTLFIHQLPSVSLALVKGDRLVWARAFGYQNLAKSVPADAETVYVTGSIFKVIVATALMQAVDEGKLDLDKPVNSYLKEFKVENPFEEEVPLTPRHLLCHRGGVPNGAVSVPVWKRDLPRPVEKVLRESAKVKTRPGTKTEYSNIAFTLNAYLLGEVTGQSWDAALKRRLLLPLGMTSTEFEPTAAMVENQAVPYQVAPSGLGVQACARVRLDVYPAGDVYSTPTDIARFLMLHLNDGKAGDKQLVSRKSLDEMARVQLAKPEEKTGFGLAWVVGSRGGHRYLEHNGSVPGFFTYMGIDPERKLGVVLFTNQFTLLEIVSGAYQDPLGPLAELAYALLEQVQ